MVVAEGDADCMDFAADGDGGSRGLGIAVWLDERHHDRRDDQRA
jgi:hypothetical protein